MEKKNKILIMTRENLTCLYFVDKIVQQKNVVGVIFERLTFKQIVKLLKYRTKKLGILKVLDQILFQIYYRICLRTKYLKANEKYFPFINKDLTKIIKKLEDKHIPVIRVDDINEDRVVNYINHLSPDLIVVDGTSIIKKKIIEKVKGNILNVHFGITPEYRGVFGGFWPVYFNEPEKVGVTIHYINQTVDEGNIILQQPIKLEKNDNFLSIEYKQLILGTDLMIKAIDNFEKKQLMAFHKKDSKSRQHYHPGLTDFIKFRKNWQNITILKTDIQRLSDKSGQQL